MVLQRRILELNPGFLAKFFAGGFAAVPDLTGGRRGDPFHDFDRGSLACAIRPQEAETAALGHDETHVVHGNDAWVVFDQISSLEGGAHWGSGFATNRRWAVSKKYTYTTGRVI